MEFSLLWAALTAVGFGWVGLRIWDERLPNGAGDRLMLATLLGLVAGRLAAMISQGTNPMTHPADLIVIRGGVSTVVASSVFVVTLLWTTRTTVSAADAMAPAILLALAGWHTGCLWRDACLGTASNLPWAWSQGISTVERHPVELYAAVALGLAAWLVSHLGWRPWLRFGTGVALAALARLVTEPIRPSIGGGAAPWYLTGVLLGVALVLLGPVATRRMAAEPT